MNLRMEKSKKQPNSSGYAQISSTTLDNISILLRLIHKAFRSLYLFNEVAAAVMKYIPAYMNIGGKVVELAANVEDAEAGAPETDAVESSVVDELRVLETIADPVKSVGDAILSVLELPYPFYMLYSEIAYYTSDFGNALKQAKELDFSPPNVPRLDPYYGPWDDDHVKRPLFMLHFIENMSKPLASFATLMVLFRLYELELEQFASEPVSSPAQVAPDPGAPEVDPDIEQLVGDFFAMLEPEDPDVVRKKWTVD